MKRIFLIGYMGSGKTTLGKAFARAMQLQFIDLDWYIEERFHKTVQELFAERGENGFREIERNIAKAKRPLLADKTDDELMNVITSALQKRMDFYRQAKYTFNAERLESYEQIGESVKKLKLLLDK